MDLNPRLHLGNQSNTADRPLPLHPSSYYPPLPSSQLPSQSFDPHGQDPDPDPDPDPDGYADLKRPRACEACRQLKVRCEPDPKYPDGPSCKRCAKAGRSCVVTVPTRKRQKKTDTRVAELERKIDALTASLQSSHSPQSDSIPVTATPRDDHARHRWRGAAHPPAANGPPPTDSAGPAGTKRRWSGELKDTPPESGSWTPSYTPDTDSAVDMGSRYWRANTTAAPRLDSSPEAIDIIEREIVSPGIAAQAFTRFVEDMSCHIPMVVFPAGTQMHEVRRTKPALFHAIVAVAIGTIQPDIHLKVLNDFHRMVAERIVVRGEKSLDLTQALLVISHWYTPPDHFEQLQFYQLTHMAVTMAIDLGMYRSTPRRHKPFSVMKDALGQKGSRNMDTPEVRRTWLGCYFQAVQVSISLRRPMLVRWHPYMDECIEILEQSPDALPSDEVLVHWTRLAHLTEEISLQFASDDIASSASFADPKFQYTVKVFEKQLERWKRDIPPEHRSPILDQAANVVSLYIYENAMHFDTAEDGSDSSDDPPPPTSATHMHALTACLTAIHGALDSTCAIDLDTFLCLPTVVLARTSFAMVLLLRLHAVAAAPETGVGQVVEPSSVEAESYLDRVIKHYSAAGNRPGGRTPAKFAIILEMLRGWFQKRRDQTLGLKQAFNGFRGKVGSTCPQDLGAPVEPAPHRSPPQGATGGPTPLHLLSEVAMGEPSTHSTTPSHGSSHGAPYHPGPGSTAVPHPNIDSTAPGPSHWAGYPAPARPFDDSSGFAVPYPADMTTTTAPNAPPAYPSGDPHSTMPGAAQGFFVPDHGMQMGMEPENLFALENILGVGLLNMPLADGSIGFY